MPSLVEAQQATELAYSEISHALDLLGAEIPHAPKGFWTYDNVNDAARALLHAAWRLQWADDNTSTD